MNIWQTSFPLDKHFITLLLILPKGSRDDQYPHEHHLIEHLIFEIIMPNGHKLRDFLDEKAIQSTGTTSRDCITISFTISTTNCHINDLLSVISCMFEAKWDSESEKKVVSTLENEMFSIPANMVKSARLSAEFSYWGEVDNLDPLKIRSTMSTISINLSNYLRKLLEESIVMIDDPTRSLYPSLIKNFGEIYVNENQFVFNNTNKLVNHYKSNFRVPIRPSNLSSIVFGIDRQLNIIEQLSALSITFCLTRGLRKGILWKELEKKDFSLYHMIAWFQSTQKDAVLSIDWISLPDIEFDIKKIIFNSIKLLIQDKKLLEKELENSINEIRVQIQRLKDMPVSERLKATAREIKNGSSNPGYLGLVNNVNNITPTTCQNILVELVKKPLLFIDQKAQAKFQSIYDKRGVENNGYCNQ